MNGQETLKLITYISQYDPTMSPAQESDQLVKATAWAALLDGIDLEDALDVVHDHYRRSDKHISPAQIRQSVFNTKAAAHRKARHKDTDLDTSKHPPPADLLDRSNPCPKCNARPGQECRPRMPFGINHLDRNPISVTKYEQHAEFERLRDTGHTGLICECGCGYATKEPASFDAAR